ncbi:MAG: hypothetical protein EB119_10940, partial [Synechococcaceae bacterium WBB_34_004]|nr:hypothetical protein [Synechococcaceae bacterium WBB_34_004]
MNNGSISTTGGISGSTANRGGDGRIKLTAASFSQPGSISGMVDYRDRVVDSLTVNVATGVATFKTVALGTTTLDRVWEPSPFTRALVSSKINNLRLEGAGTFNWDEAPTSPIQNITVGTGTTVTATEFKFYKNTATAAVNAGTIPTWPVFSTDPVAAGFSATPPTGNGRLVINALGSIVVDSGAVLTMNGKGYPGGGTGPGQSAVGRSHGFAPQGYGAGGAGLSDNGGGASYGTLGLGTTAGQVYGALDPHLKLYLGSGGASFNAGDRGQTCTWWCAWYSGGRGGGSIALHAADITIAGT